MGVEQHAEAAKAEIAATYLREALSGNVLRPIQVREQETVPIIAKHMQAAVDEAIAEKMIGVLDRASNHVHEVDLLRARIAELEGLGPLIEEYAEAYFDRCGYVEVKAKINAILKGGAS